MVSEISEIKQIRKKIGITQGELSKLAGVSQSLITKVESGSLDPTYTNAKKIFRALEGFMEKSKIKIESVLVKKIISILSTDTIKQAIEKMKNHEISQLPVIEEKKAIGIITEGMLLDALINGKNNASVVGDIMGDIPPTLSLNADIDVATSLLKYYPLIIITNKEKLIGVVTKADLLKTFSKK